MWNTRALDRREWGWIIILPNPMILRIGYRHKANDQARIVWHPMSIDQKLSSSGLTSNFLFYQQQIHIYPILKHKRHHKMNGFFTTQTILELALKKKKKKKKRV